MKGFWVIYLGLSEYINVNITCQRHSWGSWIKDEALILRCDHQ